MPAAGDLRERIAFDEVVIGKDAGGETVEDVEERFVVWAQRKFLRGGEGIQAARLEGRQPLLLIVRASSQTRMITTDWRARDTRSAAIYNIKSVEPSADRAWIEMLCESGVAV